MQEKAYSRKENHTIGKPLVVIDNISKQFPGNEFKSVEDISLTINEGELFALLGPSGCGKTTLMRMIAGFEMPTEGTISIDGVDMNDIPPYQRPVNIMFQSYALFPHMNVEHNIAFGLHQEKLPKDEINKRVAEALAMVKVGMLPLPENAAPVMPTSSRAHTTGLGRALGYAGWASTT